jgi:hypothetical protein
VPIAAIAAGLDERHTSYALTMSSPRWHAHSVTGDAVRRRLTSLSPLVTQLVGESPSCCRQCHILSMTRTWSMNLSWKWPSHLGHHLLAAGGATYRESHLSPSHLTHLDDDGDRTLTHKALVPIDGFSLSPLISNTNSRWNKTHTHIYTLEKEHTEAFSGTADNLCLFSLFSLIFSTTTRSYCFIRLPCHNIVRISFCKI